MSVKWIVPRKEKWKMIWINELSKRMENIIYLRDLEKTSRKT